MDISTIIKSLDISSVKVFLLRIFGGAEAVYDYIIGKALNAVNTIADAHGETIQSIRTKMATISRFAEKYACLLPDSWMPYAAHLNDCFTAVYDASGDGKITREEVKRIVDSFKIAYADYMAD